MILKLTKSFNPGDADTSGPYQYLHIEILVYNSPQFTVTLQYLYGNLDDNGIWVPGKASPHGVEVVNPDELWDFAQTKSAPNEPALITTQRLSYEFLRDKRGFAGTVDLSLPNDPIPAPQYAAAVQAAQQQQTPSTPSTAPSSGSSSSSSSSDSTDTQG